MQIELIRSLDSLEGSNYFEFQPGANLGNHWGRDSVYLHVHVFDLVAHVFVAELPEFAYLGPTTISGRRIEKLAGALDNFATMVNEARAPNAVWDPNEGMVIQDIWDDLVDWTTAKMQVSVMLRDLSQWMRSVAARSEPVTILGI